MDLGVKSGMLTRVSQRGAGGAAEQGRRRRVDGSPAPRRLQVQDGTLAVEPGQELKIPISPSMALNKNMVLEFSLKVEKLPEAATVGRQAPAGTADPSDGRHRFQGHPRRKRSVTGAAARVDSRRNLPRTSPT